MTEAHKHSIFFYLCPLFVLVENCIALIVFLAAWLGKRCSFCCQYLSHHESVSSRDVRILLMNPIYLHLAACLFRCLLFRFRFSAFFVCLLCVLCCATAFVTLTLPNNVWVTLPPLALFAVIDMEPYCCLGGCLLTKVAGSRLVYIYTRTQRNSRDRPTAVMH